MILLFDGPAMMRQADQRASDAVAGSATRYALTRGVVPRSRSKSSQTSGASRRRAPVVGGGDAQGREVGRPRTIGAVAPRRRVAKRARAGWRRWCARLRVDVSSISWSRVGGRLRPGLRGGTATRRRAAKDGQRRRDAERIRQLQAMQGAAQRRVVAEFRVAEHGGDLEARRADLPQQRERQAPLLLKPQRRRNLRALPRLGRQPRLGQIQRGAQHPGAHARPERGGDGHLAVGDFAQRRRSTAARRRPSVGPASGKLVPSRISTPVRSGITVRSCRQTRSALQGACGDEVLERLIGPGIGDALEHRAHRLASTVAEQPEQIATKRAALRDVREAHFERRLLDWAANTDSSFCNSTP